jgi:hypothetical protein
MLHRPRSRPALRAAGVALALLMVSVGTTAESAVVDGQHTVIDIGLITARP